MKITMIGHSTVLIEIAGQKILTDPYFGTWGNPAYARVAPPAKLREALQDVDLVLISHLHWDHTDAKYLRALTDIPIVVPYPTQWLVKLLYQPQTLVGMRPWESKTFGGCTITAVPAIHIAMTAGFVIQGEGQHLYFAGDTYYHTFMKEIGQKFDLDIALMPVTTFRIPMTMNEKSAVNAARDLKASTIIPIHLGIAPRTPLLRTNHTPEGFAQRVDAANLETEVIILKEGESWNT